MNSVNNGTVLDRLSEWRELQHDIGSTVLVEHGVSGRTIFKDCGRRSKFNSCTSVSHRIVV